jgi:hypothetical protein
MSDFWKFLIATLAGGATSYLIQKAFSEKTTTTQRIAAVERRR